MIRNQQFIQECARIFILLILNGVFWNYIFLMSNPQLATEFKNKGNEAFKAQKYEEAIQLFTKAIENNPNDHVFFSNRSGAYLNNGDHEKALEDAQTCVKMNPTWPRGYQRKGTALFYLDKIDEAIAVYKEGLNVDPNNADLQKDLKSAESKKKQGANPGMNQAYLQAMLKLMSHPETKEMFSDPSFMQKLQVIMQNPQMASVLLQQDPRLQKVFDVLNQESSPNEMDDLKNMFEKQNFATKGKKEKEEQHHKQEQSHTKKQQPKQEKMDIQDPSQQFKNKGNEEFKKKNFNEALNLYEEAIKVNPNQPLYYNNKAAAFIETKEFQAALGEIAKAEKLFEEGVAKDFVKKAKVLARKGTIYFRLQKYDEAILYLQKSLLEDTNYKVKDELLKIKKLKKQKQAKQYINPALAEEHNEKGASLYKEGKFPQALKQYQEAIKRNPDVAKYFSNVGQVYIKLMQFQRAKEHYQLALKKDPNFVKAYHKKGDCHYLMKEYHKAMQSYEAGLKRDPNDKFCKEGIQKTQATIFQSNSEEDQQERAKKAMADPEIQAILNTPQVRNALSQLERDPKSLSHILQNKSIAQKLQKLIAAGILRVG